MSTYQRFLFFHDCNLGSGPGTHVDGQLARVVEMVVNMALLDVNGRSAQRFHVMRC